jgi:hypothetical protein
MDTDGNVFMVKGFHQEWVEKNLGNVENIKSVTDVIDKMNWINLMIYKDGSIEFHVKSIDDSVIKRIEDFLSKTSDNWKSAHIFTTEKESLYLKMDKNLFEENEHSIKDLIEKKKLVAQYY